MKLNLLEDNNQSSKTMSGVLVGNDDTRIIMSTDKYFDTVEDMEAWVNDPNN